jgi:hypothetical protein
MGFWESTDKRWVVGMAALNLWVPSLRARRPASCWMRATVFKPLGAALLALLLVWAAAHSRPWHALEFRSFDLRTTLAAPGAAACPWPSWQSTNPAFSNWARAGRFRAACTRG